MENHFHLFLQISEINLNEAIQHLQGRYAQYVNLRHKRTGALFQGRYRSPLVNEEQYALALVRYIHHNPMKAGIVQTLAEYRWSSYLSYIGSLPKWNWLDTEWILRQFHEDLSSAVDLFRLFHQNQPPQTESKTIDQMKRFLGHPKSEGVRPLLPKKGLPP